MADGFGVGRGVTSGAFAVGSPPLSVYAYLQDLYGNTAQYGCGFFWKNQALILSLFLDIHKVCLRKTAIIRTRFFSESALAALCGIALFQKKALCGIVNPHGASLATINKS